MSATHAGAQPAPPVQQGFSLIAGAAVTHDSNLFRLTPSQDPNLVLGAPSGADTVTQFYGGLRFDRDYSQQHIQLEMRASQYRYQRFDYLDYEALDYRAAWRYHFTPYLRGTLSADRNEAQVPFSDYQTRELNVRVTETQAVNAEFSVSPVLLALIGTSRSDQSTSVQVLAEADFRMTRVEAGVRYLPTSGSSLSFVQRRGDGAYGNRVAPLPGADNGFREHDSVVEVTWALTARSQLRGNVVWFSREHDNLSQQDDSGYRGQASFAWDPSAKLHLELLGASSIAPYYDGLGSYRRETGYTISPAWQPLAKVTVNAELQRTDTEFNGPARRDDRQQRAALGAQWAATRNATLGARIERQRRKSTDAAFDFITTITSFNLSLAF